MPSLHAASILRQCADPHATTSLSLTTTPITITGESVIIAADAVHQQCAEQQQKTRHVGSTTDKETQKLVSAQCYTAVSAKYKVTPHASGT